MRPFSPLYIPKVFFELLTSFPVTVLMLAGSVIFGSLLGFVLARAKISGGKISKILADAYIGVMRCTPPIVLLFIVYYGLPELLLSTAGIDINNVNKGVFVLVTYTLLYGATISEIMRSAYESVDKGQWEAAVSIGLSPFQAFYRIMLPQATAVALPNFCNLLINLMKDGALAFTIGLVDIMGRGSLIISRNFGAYALETYIALALIYWCLTLVIEKTFSVLEKSLLRGKRSLAE
ncbi:amino acid ABC transporter permease [Thermoclostridium stercorarium]|uniref:Amino acid ABC transporter permease n=1 Tax=Thermoclostridium stercorarium subsp. leptospartum DSM 9219 TaxID=1346611 RepID=A0A1B1YLU5_THEST|nr:amino acid ABC transporter permease [Thermoclostridium stercorarium]ANX01713.1 amino acid ABC transporter permease [Thermoclostridium stercorarium subsp. leptospartum DSM 9219]UZQ84839.1 amino acid ABC transporter permease [Thermoclostridium stercorarium]